MTLDYNISPMATVWKLQLIIIAYSCCTATAHSRNLLDKYW